MYALKPERTIRPNVRLQTEQHQHVATTRIGKRYKNLMEGAGQNLERRFRLPVWQESMLWMQSRCSDLLDSGREADAKSVLVEFRIHEII